MSATILSVFYGKMSKIIVAIIILIAVCLLVFLTKPYNFSARHPSYSDEYVSVLQKTERRAKSVLKIALSILLLAVVIFSGIPCVWDFFVINRQDFSRITGQVVSMTNITNKNNPDSIVVLNEATGKEMSFKAFLSPQRPGEGDVVDIIYLPGTKYATVRVVDS